MIRKTQQRLSNLLFSSGFLSGWSHLRKSLLTGPTVNLLGYHHIVPSDCLDELNQHVSVEQFDAHLRYLKQNFQILPLEDAVQRLQDGSLHSDCVVITFDDGYLDNFVHAFPILRKYDVPATIFLISGLIGTNGVPWYDELRELLKQTRPFKALQPAPDGLREPLKKLQSILNREGSEEKRLEAAVTYAKTLKNSFRIELLKRLRASAAGPPLFSDNGLRLMDWDQAREMQEAGIRFGSHTVTHPILNTLDDEELERELVSSRLELEAKLGTRCNTLAFPNGTFDERVVAFAGKAGYRYACTQIFGRNGKGADPLRLRRISLGNVPVAVVAAKLSGVFDPVFALRRIWRDWNRRGAKTRR